MVRHNRSLTLLAASALVAGVALVPPLIALRVDPSAYEGGRSRDAEDRLERNTSAVAIMLGELRTSTSDILFLKTERYLHSGVAYMPHMDNSLTTIEGETRELGHRQEEALVQAAGLEHDDHDDHAGTPTLIRSPDNDFRSLIGHLHRQVKPWRDPDEPHLHTDGVELLPWYRVMTLADPQNVRAYAIGGWWLKSIDPHEGLAFLEEGRRNNPGSFQILYMRGRLLEQIAVNLRAENPEANANAVLARRHEAREAFQEGARLGIVRRPAGWTYEEPKGAWTDTMEDDLRGCIRLAVLYERAYGDPQKAREMAGAYVQQLGGDAILARIARGTPE